MVNTLLYKRKLNSMYNNKHSIQTDKNYSLSQVSISNLTHVSTRRSSEERKQIYYGGFYLGNICIDIFPPFGSTRDTCTMF